MSVYVNRVLNFRKIKAIGFDMDHTIIKYNTKNFEELTYRTIIEILITKKNYPRSIRDLKFNMRKMSNGLMIDLNEGTIIKTSRFGKVKRVMRGTRILDYKTTQELYSNHVVDPRDEHIFPLNTSFSLAHGILFAELIQRKIDGTKLPGHKKIAHTLKEILDDIHTDGSLKSEVNKNLNKYIVRDKKMVDLLMDLKESRKKVFLITNSDFDYTKKLLDYAINPFLSTKYNDWTELFDLVVAQAQKPAFFTETNNFFEISVNTGWMKNTTRPLKAGVYQGGNSKIIEEDFNLKGEDILYLGDHIYGDVVSLKKKSGWRTGMVIESLHDEIESLRKVKHVQKKIDEFMARKRILETELNKLFYKREKNQIKIKSSFAKIEVIDSNIQKEISKYQRVFNMYWGEMMRAGQEESFFADLVQRYACIYMSSVTDLLDFTPRTYFRPYRREMAHEKGSMN